ncbi:hypothetical protein [Streptomyces sp. NPDC000351]|uniref:hypothetical protein n=1 Tax=Streptomyces sp. NPDC000351 TaxID=3154250 RepID=UPI00332A6449
MPKTWKPGDEKRFAREIKLNKPYYTVCKIATNLAPWEDAELYSEIVFTKRVPILGTPCTATGYDAETFLRLHGPVHDSPPRGMRNIADAARSAGAPLGDNYEGILDEAEIRGLEKLASQASNPRNRRPIGSWRP